MQRILLHTCCGPCLIAPLQKLRALNWSVHGFFYNPNVQPYQELERRLEALKWLSQREGLKLIIRGDYALEEFIRQTAFRESQRCIYCYSIRLEATARLAKKSRFDAFTTTLLYSKLQKHELIRSIAEEAAGRIGIAFLYEDFRTEWRKGQEAARQSGIYRQQYCGCIYSEKERFYRRK
jgi:epoxyqueuosine reductase